MKEEILAEQRELVSLLESEGWDVTETELSEYDSPFADDDTPEATITLTARKQFPDDEDGENSYRVDD